MVIYYLSHHGRRTLKVIEPIAGEIKGFMPLAKTFFIANVIAKLEFKLAYYDIVV